MQFDAIWCNLIWFDILGAGFDWLSVGMISRGSDPPSRIGDRKKERKKERKRERERERGKERENDQSSHVSWIYRPIWLGSVGRHLAAGTRTTRLPLSFCLSVFLSFCLSFLLLPRADRRERSMIELHFSFRFRSVEPVTLKEVREVEGRGEGEGGSSNKKKKKKRKREREKKTKLRIKDYVNRIEKRNMKASVNWRQENPQIHLSKIQQQQQQQQRKVELLYLKHAKNKHAKNKKKDFLTRADHLTS